MAHSAVIAAGGYGSTGAIMPLALAAGLAVGAIAVGIAWRERRWLIAVLLMIALVAGEAWGLLTTAGRVMAQREEAQTPLRAAGDLRTKAVERVAVAEALLAAAPRSARLTAAEQRKIAADEAVVAKAAETGCAANCRMLLAQQVELAAAEVAAARAEIDGAKAKAEAELQAARVALAAVPVPASSTPLADRLGLAGWQVDLASAGLASVAANGLAALLLAFSAHWPRRHPSSVIDAISETSSAQLPMPQPPARLPDMEANRFAVDTLRPDAEGSTRLHDLRDAYHRWCAARGLEPLPDREIAAALNALFARIGLTGAGSGSEAAIVGVTIRPALPALAA